MYSPSPRLAVQAQSHQDVRYVLHSPFRMSSVLVAQDGDSVDGTAGLEVLAQLLSRRLIVHLCSSKARETLTAGETQRSESFNISRSRFAYVVHVFFRGGKG